MSAFRACLQGRFPLLKRTATTKDSQATFFGAAALLSVGIGVTVSAPQNFGATPSRYQQLPVPSRPLSRDPRWTAPQSSPLLSQPTYTLTESVGDFPKEYTEKQRFFQTLEYHRCLLPDYHRRWEGTSDDAGAATAEATAWPRRVPTDKEISALEMDLNFCLKSPDHKENMMACHKQQFRVASYYVLQHNDPAKQQKGYRMVKELAEHGYPDGMCFYGIIMNEGLVEGVDVNPRQAVLWWRRCIGLHRHIKATYELAVALYTGEGVPENPQMAVSLFYQTAHLGLASAAYMLSECLLDGVGIERDRADALEWLTTAAELGHELARKRVILVLRQDYEKLHHDEKDAREDCPVEMARWMNGDEEDSRRQCIVERKFTIGGGSRNPMVAARRKTKVSESREEEV
jgi:hypothetical protein